jgi:hypothetical protein
MRTWVLSSPGSKFDPGGLAGGAISAHAGVAKTMRRHIDKKEKITAFIAYSSDSA